VEDAKRRILNECLICGACLEQCPVFPSRQFTDADSIALTEGILQVLEGGDITDEVYHTLWSCMACAQCRQWCPVDISPSTMFSLARREMTRRGRPLPDLLDQWSPDSRYNFHRVISAMQIKPSDRRWLSRAPDNPQPADVVVFLGCIMRAMPGIAFTLVDILERMGIDFTMLGGDLCCGSAYGLVGNPQKGETAAAEAWANILAFQPRTIVFECGSCYGRFSQRPPAPPDFPVQCQPYTEFLLDNLDKINFTTSIDKVVTYHDACDRRRSGIGDYATPRRLLQAIPGIKLVEMAHNRDDALCCGGLANSTFPEVTRGVRMARLEEARTAGADLIVTGCRSCYTALAGLDDGYPQVTHDILLIGEAMGISHPETFRQLLHCPDLDRALDESRDNITAHNLDPDQVTKWLGRYLSGLRPPAPGN